MKEMEKRVNGIKKGNSLTVSRIRVKKNRNKENQQAISDEKKFY